MICKDCKKSIVDKYFVLKEEDNYHLYLIAGCVPGIREILCLKCGIDKFENFLVLKGLTGEQCRTCVDMLKEVRISR